MRRRVVVLVAAAAALAACSSSSTKASPGPPNASMPTTTPYRRPACQPPATAAVHASQVPGSRHDYDVTSFDGTKIRAHWFPVSNPPANGAPTVLKGPGWGGAGDVDTTATGYGLFGDLSIRTLQSHGYNVLTWDPRGFGKSGGTVETDSPDFEGRDVEELISWAATLPGVQLDAKNDPRMGMVGASYGGGIQLTIATIDCRVDAIVPQLAWHSLGTSLYKAQTAKTGWGNLLYGISAGRSVDPHMTSAHTDSDASGTIKPADIAWFESRGPGDNVAKITAPTLFEQGTIDTLFTLDEAVENYTILEQRGVPTAMLWVCSGHGVCLTKPGDQLLPGNAALAWLDRYVKDDPQAQLGPGFRWVDQNGDEHSAATYPPPSAPPIDASGTGTLTMTAAGGSGPPKPTGNAGVLGQVALGITPAKAAHAVNIKIPFNHAAEVLGAPELTLRYSGTTPPGTRPTRVFAQLVDGSTGIVLGNQITPIDVTLDGKQHTTTVRLEMVVFSAQPGAPLTLQLVATTSGYAQPRLGGTVDFRSVRVELPTVGRNSPG